MTSPAQPRHARAEIRAFAKWMKDQGWTYERTDSLGHTIWSHPKATDTYKLPETPSHFNVKRARGDVQRLMGIKHQGKHRGKPSVSAPRRDFALEQLRRAGAREGGGRTAGRGGEDTGGRGHVLPDAMCPLRPRARRRAGVRGAALRRLFWLALPRVRRAH